MGLCRREGRGKPVITDLKWRATLSRRARRSSFVTQQENRNVRLQSIEIDVRGGYERLRLNAGSLTRARRVNTARQSKDLPSSHYLIIGVILNRCKSHLRTGRVTSRRLGVLSNDLLLRERERERRSFVRHDSGRVEIRCACKASDLILFSCTLASRRGGSYIFLISHPNYPKVAVYLSQRGKRKDG